MRSHARGAAKDASEVSYGQTEFDGKVLEQNPPLRDWRPVAPSPVFPALGRALRRKSVSEGACPHRCGHMRNDGPRLGEQPHSQEKGRREYSATAKTRGRSPVR
jgi:hypothetical protein